MEGARHWQIGANYLDLFLQAERSAALAADRKAAEVRKRKQKVVEQQAYEAQKQKILQELQFEEGAGMREAVQDKVMPFESQ